MTQKPLESHENGDTKEQGAGCLQHSDPSNHSDPVKEDRAMADDSQYTDSARADNPINQVKIARLGKPSPEFVRLIIQYMPETGRFYWLPRSVIMFEGDRAEIRCRQWNTRYAGKETFLARDTRGYAQAAIFDRQFLGHRVAWAIYYGNWPSLEIDHIDRVRDNNRIENLRDVTRSVNLKNRGWQSIGSIASRLAEKARGDA